MNYYIAVVVHYSINNFVCLSRQIPCLVETILLYDLHRIIKEDAKIMHAFHAICYLLAGPNCHGNI